MGSQNKPLSKDVHEAQQSDSNRNSKHPRFIDAKIVSDVDQNNYFQVTQSIGIMSIYQSWEKRLTQIKNKIGPNSLFLPIQCNYQQEGLCGTAGILKFKFEHYPFLLQQQIVNRQLQVLQFEDKQIWFLLYILSQTAASLHRVGLTVGDIRPKNIFINQTGDISVLSNLSFPQQYTNYQKSSYLKQSTYLPPEGSFQIQNGKQLPSYDQKIGQSFSIGLTILDGIFLADHSALYDKFLKFNEIAFKEIIESLKKSNIDEKLKGLLLLMLKIDPQSRLTCQQLCEYLAPYQKQIFELEDFSIKTQFTNKRQESSNQKLPSSSSKSLKGKRQNLSRPISLENTDKKQNSGNKSSEYSNQLSKHVENNFSNQDKTKSIKNSNNSVKQNDLQKDKLTYETQQFKGLQNKQLNYYPSQSVESLNNNFYHISKPQYKNQVSSGNETYVQRKINQNETKSTQNISFKTGNLFKKDRNSHQIIPIETAQLGNRSGLISNLGYNNYGNQFKIQKVENSVYPSAYRQNQFKPSYQFNSQQGGSQDHYSDFLKNIDKQLQQSRKMFPDSFK